MPNQPSFCWPVNFGAELPRCTFGAYADDIGAVILDIRVDLPRIIEVFADQRSYGGCLQDGRHPFTVGGVSPGQAEV